MERYHIFKLGLAILFYAAYCVRPTLVVGLKVNDIAHSKHRSEPGRQILGESLVFYQGVDGTPGIDFPILSYIPKTAFTCKDIETGYYADLDTDCQVFHICEEGRKISFLCPNGTIFQQSDLICEWWYKVDCSNSPNLYEESAEQLKEDVARRKANRRINANAQMTNYGAVMRTEEVSTVSVKKNGKPYEVRLRKDKKLVNKVTGAPSHINRFNDLTSDSVPKSAIELEKSEVKDSSYRQTTEDKPKRYNDQHTGNFLNNQRTNEENLKEYHQQFSATSPGLDAAASVENVYVSSTSPSFTYNVSPSQASINKNFITNRGSVKYSSPSFRDENTNADEYNLAFPTHKSQISNERGKATPKIDSDRAAVDSKPKSSVPLTRNDIINRRVEQNESEELQIPQETAGFVTNSYNSIQSGSSKFSTTNPHPNHRTIYSDLKQPKFTSTKVSNTISSVTPQYITTQSINSGKPFIGSTVGVRIFGGDFRKGVNTSVPSSTTQSPAETSTRRVVDHATVYGTFSRSTTLRPSTSPDGVQVKFSKDTDKIGVQLSKSIGGSPAVEVSTYKPGTNKFGQTSLEINGTPRPDFKSSFAQSSPDSTSFDVSGRFADSPVSTTDGYGHTVISGQKSAFDVSGTTDGYSTTKFEQSLFESSTPSPTFGQSTLKPTPFELTTSTDIPSSTTDDTFGYSSIRPTSFEITSTDVPPISTTDKFGRTSQTSIPDSLSLTTLKPKPFGVPARFGNTNLPSSGTTDSTDSFGQTSRPAVTNEEFYGQSTLGSTSSGTKNVPSAGTTDSTDSFGQTLRPTGTNIKSFDRSPLRSTSFENKNVPSAGTTDGTDSFEQTSRLIGTNVGSFDQSSLRSTSFGNKNVPFAGTTDSTDSFGQTSRPAGTNEELFDQSTLRSTSFGGKNVPSAGTTDSFGQTSRPITNTESLDQSTPKLSPFDLDASYRSKNVVFAGTTDGTDSFGQTTRPAITNEESFGQSTLRSTSFGSKNVPSAGTTDGTDSLGQTSTPATTNTESFDQSTPQLSPFDRGASYRSKNVVFAGTIDSTDSFGQTAKPAATNTESFEQGTPGPKLLDVEVKFGGRNVPSTTESYGTTSFVQTSTSTDLFGQSTVRPTPFESITKYEKTEVPPFSTVGTIIEEITTKTGEGTTKSPFADGTTRFPFLFSTPTGVTPNPKYGSAVIPPLLSPNSFLRVTDFPSSTGPKGGLILTGIGSNATFTSVESSNTVDGKSATTFRPSANEGTTSTAATYLPTVKAADSNTAKPSSDLQARFKSPSVDNLRGTAKGTDDEKSREYDDVLVPPLPSLRDLKSGTVSPKNSGFFVTKGGRDSPTTETYLQSTPQVDVNLVGRTANQASEFALSKSETQWPRPFQKSLNSIDSVPKDEPVTPTYFSYKISSARPFELPIKSTPTPTLPTPFTTASTEGSIKDNIDNMIDVLTEIVNNKNEDFSAETPRPGLVVPPSAGPQTLHTLAQYFANALDGIAAEREKETGEELDDDRKEKLTSLLTQMTMYRYNELFKSTEAPTTESAEEILEGEHTENFNETPALKQLARNFSLALSSYLNDPQAFRKDLESLRPTEPPPLSEDNAEETNFDEELLNFSDTDSKSSFPPAYPTVPSVSPTWGFILAKGHDDDVKNSLNPDLHTADSQSFIPAFNNLAAGSGKQKGDVRAKELGNHWTTSPGVTKLWQSTLSVNPAALNEQIGTTEIADFEATASGTPASFEPPQREIQYELRALPKLTLNSTQVHGILIDFMNTTKSDESNRLQRILKKLNTTQDEFLDKMKEIESNPLTKRLILLLISECGANVTKDIAAESITNLSRQFEDSPARKSSDNVHKPIANSDIPQLVDTSLREDDQDTRALQLLNSLYTIASKFGK